MKKDEGAAQLERVLVTGDLAQLKPEERLNYYKMVCESVGLNPLTRPLEYITLNGKLTLYARKDATDQLRSIHCVSVTIQARELTEGVYVVTARAAMPSGRTDESIGAVPIENLKGESRANAMMKAETKAKRRATLSICGMGMLDETEIETIPGARVGDAPAVTTAPKTFGTPKATIEPLPPLEVLVESATKAQEPEFIDRGMVVNFNRSFRENLPKEHQAQGEALRHAWLAAEGIVDPDGNPTANAIIKTRFEEIRAKAIAYAKEYK